MPTFSPDETKCPLLGQLGLSPKSYEEFQKRENSRISNITESWFDQNDQDEEKDSDDDETSTDGLYSDSIEKSGSDNDNDSDVDDCIFQFDEQSKPHKKKSRNTKPPFWYESEDAEHLRKIVDEYSREINATDEIDKMRISGLIDRRRLPTFVGRIRRTPVIDRDSIDDFTTLDKVDIFRRDIRPCGSCTTLMTVHYYVTSWDEDGMPDNFVILNKKQFKEWKNKKTIEKYPISYIYCLPVWQSQTAFEYSVEKEKHDVGYAGQPFNYTQFLPKNLFVQPEEFEEG